MKNPAEMTYMEHLEMSDMLDVELRTWYMWMYPTDDCGRYISKDATFGGLYMTLIKGEDVYDYIGEGDSVIRERLFTRLSDILEEDYAVIYDLWLASGRG